MVSRCAESKRRGKCDLKRTSATSKSQAAAPDLVVVGSVAQDILHTATASTGKVLGGSAVHFANAASFFARVGIVGIVGDDYPRKDLDFLRRRKVDLSGIAVAHGDSFLWEGRYTLDFLERETIRTELGVFANFEPLLPEHYRHPKVLFLAAIEPRLQLSVLKQVRRPKLVATDTFKLWIDIARADFLKVLKQSDMFLCNDFEAQWLTGDHNLLRGAHALRKMGPKWLIVKKGEHGSFFVGDEGTFLSHTYPVMNVVDPTGAGDAYAGGILGYLSQCRVINEKEIRRAMGWASVIGSFYVEGFGPDGLRNKKMADLRKRYREFRRLFEIP
jgi:sugar/nucleoside kinase (ribokinase family)